MVSDSDIVTRLRKILGESDLDTATPGSVRRKLEEEFGVDLSDRKSFIRDQIDLYLNTHVPKVEDGENGEPPAADGEGGAGEEPAEDDEEEEEEKQSGAKRKAKKGSNKVDTDVKKKRGGFTKLCSLSPQLQKFVGESELARTEVVKKLWAYIRENNLQDPSNRKTILCDESLQALFRVKSIDMFKMNKSLSKHIWPLTTEGESVKKEISTQESSHSMSEADVSEEEEEKEEKKRKEKKRKGRTKGGSAKGDKETKKRGGGGFTKLCGLSPELQKFTGCSELARTEVVKRIWAYIREKELQDPKNKRNILCDEALHELFHVDSIDMFKMNKALSEHIKTLKAGDAAPDDSSQKETAHKKEEEASDDEPEWKGKRLKEEVESDDSSQNEKAQKQEEEVSNENSEWKGKRPKDEEPVKQEDVVLQ